MTNLQLEYGFCKKLLLYECNSDQLNTFFLKIRSALNPQSNFDEKSVQLVRVAFIKKFVTSYKIHILIFEKKANQF